jgi:putative flippase GtrA
VARVITPALVQFSRYIVVGAVNTLVGYILFALGIVAGVPSLLALLLATIGAMLFSFLSMRRFVFASVEGRRLPRFIVAYAVIYTVNSASLFGIESAGLGPLAAQALLVPPIVTLSFLLNRRFVFGAERYLHP